MVVSWKCRRDMVKCGVLWTSHRVVVKWALLGTCGEVGCPSDIVQ